MAIPPIVGKLWRDPVISKIISAGILGLIGYGLYFFFGINSPASNHSVNQDNSKQNALTWPSLTLDGLKNSTYQIENEDITLQEGRREFNPSYEQGKLSDQAVFVYLVDHAFGDLDGDGNVDAIAVLETTTGGTGHFYYLATVINDHGSPKVYGDTYPLGDRLVFRSVAIHGEKVAVQVMTHGPDDGLCCPSQLRTLIFELKNKSLQCKTEPCSDI